VDPKTDHGPVGYNDFNLDAPNVQIYSILASFYPLIHFNQALHPIHHFLDISTLQLKTGEVEAMWEPQVHILRIQSRVA
jgi:hypothetical protein